jgi:hypothetical protein
VHCLLGGTALPIKRHCGNTIIESRRQPAIPANVKCLRTNLADTAPDDIIDIRRIDGYASH